MRNLEEEGTPVANSALEIINRFRRKPTRKEIAEELRQHVEAFSDENAETLWTIYCFLHAAEKLEKDEVIK